MARNLFLPKSDRLVLAIFWLLFCGCTDFLDLPAPVNQVTNTSVFANDATAEAAMNGLYIQMVSNTNYFTSGGTGSIAVLAGLSADEMISYSSSADQLSFYSNNLDPANSTVRNAIWGQGYKLIFMANAVLAGLRDNPKLSPAIIAKLTGEARFIRGFCHFYLTSMFGEIPIALTTDYRLNNKTFQNPAEEVYRVIKDDLIESGRLLGDSYFQGERIRPTSHAAKALLARVYLYEENWQKAEEVSSSLLESNALHRLVEQPSGVFLKNSQEAIWQIMPVIPTYNTWEGRTLILLSRPNNVALSPTVMNWFENGDLRRMEWIDSIVVNDVAYYFPAKYKIQSGGTLVEYSMILRLAEQYLIRAEARAWLDDIPGAIQDLNSLRARAGLVPLAVNSREGVLAAIQQERRVELLSEWGHRWFDLNRTGSAEDVISTTKGITWNARAKLFPIPLTELNLNPRLYQNPGY